VAVLFVGPPELRCCSLLFIATTSEPRAEYQGLKTRTHGVSQIVVPVLVPSVALLSAALQSHRASHAHTMLCEEPDNYVRPLAAEKLKSLVFVLAPVEDGKARFEGHFAGTGRGTWKSVSTLISEEAESSTLPAKPAQT